MINSQKIINTVPIAGIESMTTIDFPDKIAAVLFTQGCPWQCRYCHNHSLTSSDSSKLLSWDSVEEFLESRTGFLEGIVLSGGEPTLHPSLPELLAWIRDLGYATAIHTNGYFPDMIRLLLKKELVDYVAMDIKAPPRAYDLITKVKNSCISVARSIEIITTSGVEYEFRTTYHPALLSEQELMETIHAVSSVGTKRYFIQHFKNLGVDDPELVASGDVITIPENVIREARKLFPVFGVR